MASNAPAFFVLSLILLLAIVFAWRGSTKRTVLASAQRPSWKPKDPAASLQELFDFTVSQGESAIDWYRINVRAKRFGSRLLRLLAIVLAAIGALLPLLTNVVSLAGRPDAQWGYIAFAAAAACVAVDKLYGFSTGWIRFIKAQLALEGALLGLQYDWAALLSKVANEQPTPDQVQSMLQRLRDFVTFVRAQIQQETEAWILEFQSSLADLANMVKSRAEAAQPGSVQVTVTNAGAFDSDIRATLDRGDERSIEGNQCLFPSVAPGPHEVQAIGKRGANSYKASGVVNVTPRSLAVVNLSLPTT